VIRLDFRHVTAAVMVGCLALALVVACYDLLPALSAAPGDTISEMTLAWWRRRPIIPLAMGLGLGVLLGHLGWPQ
jgi:hypothetical protein